MIDIQAIRSKILDLAMRGQLTEQLPEDGTAEELYQQILEEKQKLIKDGSIKKNKTYPEITNEDMLFNPPTNWKWIRFSNIITLKSGQDLKKDEYNSNNNGIPYLTGASNFNSNNKLMINRWTTCPKSTAKQGDILLSCKGTVGKIAILHEEIVHIARQFMAIRVYLCNKAFVMFFLESIIERIKKASKGLIPGIERNDILSLSIPLPPIAEQNRIVQKIKQAISILDSIDELQAQYTDNLTALKSKLIDAAIQGKLTEQLPEDGTAEELYQQIQEEKQRLIKEGKIKKQKPLPEISDDEIPFDIPDNWKWTRFADILDVRDGTHDTPKYVTDGIPLVTSKNLRNGLIDFESAKLISYEDAKQINNRSRVDDGDILLAMIGTIGNPVLVKKDREFSIKNIALFKPIDSNLLDMSFVLCYLKNEERVMQEKARGGLQPFVSLKILRTSIIPLPPLAEQKRIVQKLDEILPICERKIK